MTALQFVILGFAAAMIALTFRRKNGPFGIVKWFRDLFNSWPEPFHTISECDLCATFWTVVVIYMVSLAIPSSFHVWNIAAICGLALWLEPTMEVKVPKDYDDSK